jgi:hypothetical protein
MKKTILLALLVLAACDDRPPAPTAEQNDQLNDAEDMLDEEAAKEKGPATEAADPQSD